MNDRITDTTFLVFFFAGPVKRSSRMVREVYPEIEPEKEGNLAEGMIFRIRVALYQFNSSSIKYGYKIINPKFWFS